MNRASIIWLAVRRQGRIAPTFAPPISTLTVLARRREEALKDSRREAMVVGKDSIHEMRGRWQPPRRVAEFRRSLLLVGNNQTCYDVFLCMSLWKASENRSFSSSLG